MRWIAEKHQPNFSGINLFFLQLIRQVKNLSLAHEVINTPAMASTRLAFNSAGDLMFSLVQLQELLEKPGRGQSVIRDWQKQYFDLQKRMDRRAIIEGIRSIESIHPLLPWFDELVRRDADFFTQPRSNDKRFTVDILVVLAHRSRDSCCPWASKWGFLLSLGFPTGGSWHAVPDEGMLLRYATQIKRTLHPRYADPPLKEGK